MNTHAMFAASNNASHSKVLNYGIIGCGMMGQEHVRNIKLLNDCNVISIYEPDEGMRHAAKALLPDVQFKDTIADLVRDAQIDCLVIASPNFLHCAQLEEIARIRQVPILVEKPLFTDPADLHRIDQLTKTYQAPLWVAMEYRYMPPVAKFAQLLDETTGGVKMLTIREHRFPFLPKIGDWNRFNENTGGTLVEKCCHFFDLMRFLVRSEPVRIMASADQSVNHLQEIYNGHVPDIWDNAYVIVDFQNGARAMLELCMFAEGSKYQEEITAVGNKGKLETRVPGPTRFWPDELGPPPIADLTISPRHPIGPQKVEVPIDDKLLDAGDHNGSSFYQHQKFAAVVRGLQDIEVTIDDGAKAVLMGQAAQRSALEGRAVELKF